MIGYVAPGDAVDLDIVADRYRKLAAAIPAADIFYAIKANPAPQILELLVRLGSNFDVASPAEVDMCLAAGADPSRIGRERRRSNLVRASAPVWCRPPASSSTASPASAAPDVG